jgi:phospholipase/lecithinase/hemolysin
MRYSVGSSYNLVSFFTAHPKAAGFRDMATACCGGRRLGAETGCVPNATYCGNRNIHLFWDGVHGTQATSNKGAKAIIAALVNWDSPRPSTSSS